MDAIKSATAGGRLLIPFERLYGLTLQSNSNTFSWIARTLMTCIQKKKLVSLEHWKRTL
jgi:hypothetical protein